MPTSTKSQPASSVRRRLREFYKRSGWVQARPDPKLRAKRKANYKRGYEVRVAVASKQELAEVQRLLNQSGLKPGKPFKKVNRIVLPIYGKESVERFLELVGA
jgi:hypothetical protein